MSWTNKDRSTTDSETSDRPTNSAPVDEENPDPVDLFDPGPSFVRDDRPDLQLSDMPAWLQDFADTLGKTDLFTEDSEQVENCGGVDSETSSRTLSGHAESDSELAHTLPEWLSMPRSRSVTQQPMIEATDDSGLSAWTNDDSLPEWLRPVGPTGLAAVSGSAHLKVDWHVQDDRAVPLIAPAWVHPIQSAQLSDGGSTFAGIVDQSSPLVVQPPVEELADPEIVSLEKVVATRPSNQKRLSPNDLIGAERVNVETGRRTRLIGAMALILVTIILALLVTQFVV